MNKRFSRRRSTLIAVLSLLAIVAGSFVVWRRGGPYIPITITSHSGDRAGVGDGPAYSMATLSKSLKKYPMVNRVTVTWDYTVAVGSDHFSLVYNRSTQTLYYSGDWSRQRTFIEQETYSGVTEEAIHAIAQNGEPYQKVASYGAKRIEKTTKRS